MKRRLLLIGTAALLVLSMLTSVWGNQENSSVNVLLPDFPVTLNGIRIDNAYRQYPLITYKGITYFPMTFQDSRFLGVKTQWRGNEEGLNVEAADVSAAYYPALVSRKNSTRDQASIPDFPIQINGKTIDNSQTEFPLLLYRNVTYFPLTWEYAVDTFGWQYRFDGQQGLQIESSNLQLSQTALSGDRIDGTTGLLNNSVAISKGYVYYKSPEGRIMQAPLADPSQARLVYQLPLWTYGEGNTYVYEKLYTQNGETLLSYHQGGATMGTTYLIRLNEDGTAEELNNTRYIVHTFGDRTIRYWGGPAPGNGNLQMKIGDEEYTQIGSEDYLYGWTWRILPDSQGGSPSSNVYLIGEDLYLVAIPMFGEAALENPTNGIHRVNLATNEVTRISQREVMVFQMEGENFYYCSEGNLYRFSLQTGEETWVAKLADQPDPQVNFAVLNGHIFWEDIENQGFYRVGEDIAVNPGARLDSMDFSGDDNEYLIVTFEENPQTLYRFMVFDGEGKAVFKTSDKTYARNVTIEGDILHFYNLTTGTVCTVNLK